MKIKERMILLRSVQYSSSDFNYNNAFVTVKEFFQLKTRQRTLDYGNWIHKKILQYEKLSVLISFITNAI